MADPKAQLLPRDMVCVSHFSFVSSTSAQDGEHVRLDLQESGSTQLEPNSLTDILGKLLGLAQLPGISTQHLEKALFSNSHLSVAPAGGDRGHCCLSRGEAPPSIDFSACLGVGRCKQERQTACQFITVPIWLWLESLGDSASSPSQTQVCQNKQ